MLVSANRRAVVFFPQPLSCGYLSKEIREVRQVRHFQLHNGVFNSILAWLCVSGARRPSPPRWW